MIKWIDVVVVQATTSVIYPIYIMLLWHKYFSLFIIDYFVEVLI